MQTFVIGRDPRRVSVILSSDAVSAVHADLTVTADGRYYITDRHSYNGTYVDYGRGWERLTQGYVDADTPLLLADWQTTARQLLAQAASAAPAPPQAAALPPVPAKPRPLNGGDVLPRPRRDPSTGEIIR